MVRIEPAIASFTAGIMGLLCGFILIPKNAEGENTGKGFNTAFLPYYVLIAAVLMVMLPPPIASVAKAHGILGFSFPETSSDIWTTPAVETYNPLKLFAHPGSFILFAGILSYLIYKKKGMHIETGSLLKTTTKKTLPSFISILAILSLSTLMTESGMISVLAQKAAFVLFPFFSPLIGTLGTFITGSNTSSNMLFGAFQKTTAENMGIDPLLILGSQTAGGAIGKVFSPTDMVLAASVTGMLDREGEIMRFTVKVGVLFTVLIGVLTLLMV
jgi:lactate permease